MLPGGRGPQRGLDQGYGGRAFQTWAEGQKCTSSSTFRELQMWWGAAFCPSVLYSDYSTISTLLLDRVCGGQGLALFIFESPAQFLARNRCSKNKEGEPEENSVREASRRSGTGGGRSPCRGCKEARGQGRHTVSGFGSEGSPRPREKVFSVEGGARGRMAVAWTAGTSTVAVGRAG